MSRYIALLRLVRQPAYLRVSETVERETRPEFVVCSSADIRIRLARRPQVRRVKRSFRSVAAALTLVCVIEHFPVSDFYFRAGGTVELERKHAYHILAHIRDIFPAVFRDGDGAQLRHFPDFRTDRRYQLGPRQKRRAAICRGYPAVVVMSREKSADPLKTRIKIFTVLVVRVNVCSARAFPAVICKDLVVAAVVEYKIDIRGKRGFISEQFSSEKTQIRSVPSVADDGAERVHTFGERCADVVETVLQRFMIIRKAGRQNVAAYLFSVYVKLVYAESRRICVC